MKDKVFKLQALTGIVAMICLLGVLWLTNNNHWVFGLIWFAIGLLNGWLFIRQSHIRRDLS